MTYLFFSISLNFINNNLIKKMKKLSVLAFFIFAFFTTNLYSQTLDVDTTSLNYYVLPEDSARSIKVAYTEYEPALLADIDWLTNTPVGENQSMRDEKSRFVFMWMSGSPTVKVQLDDRIVTFFNSDPSILMAYMMGWTKYSILNNYSDDPIEASVAGITNAVKFYNVNRKMIKKNKELEKYKKMISDGTLRRYVADVLTRPQS